MSVVEDNLLERGNLLCFKLAEGKRFDLVEIPLMCELQNRGPLVNGGLVNRVFSGV
jgi:hypothetical protein